MSTRAERILSKITRAMENLVDLQLAISAFRDSNPYEIRMKEDAASGKRIYYVHRVSSVPDPLTNIAADVIQNIRSPLDQVVSQLMIDGGADEAALKRAEYPIRDRADHYPSARGRIAQHVRKEAIDAIDATEPYKGGKGHAIWQLNALNNPDKHLLPIAAYVQSAAPSLSGILSGIIGENPVFARTVAALPEVFINPADKRTGRNPGDEVFSEPMNAKMPENRKFQLQIAFDEPGIIESEPVLKFLHDTANLVDDIVTRLTTLLK